MYLDQERVVDRSQYVPLHHYSFDLPFLLDVFFLH